MAKKKTVKKAVKKSLKKVTRTKVSAKPEIRHVAAEIVEDHEVPALDPESDEATFEPVEDEHGFDAEISDESDVELDEKPKARRKKSSRKGSLVPSTGREVTTSMDPVQLYLQELRKYPVLTREQEFELAKNYYETKDPVAAQALVTANLRFVVKVAAEYSKFGAKLIDLVQEGNMGLMHAVRDFNPYRGVRVITYAVWWIRGYIQEYLMKQYSLVKIGTTQNQKKLFYRLQKEKDALDALGERPDVKMIGTKLGIAPAEVQEMSQRLRGRDVSLSQTLDDDSKSSMMDFQKSDQENPDDALGRQEELYLLKERLAVLRPDLSEREKIILDERLLADEPLTLQEIGEKHGITREAVRQMESRLLEKIRKSFVASGIKA